MQYKTKGRNKLIYIKGQQFQGSSSVFRKKRACGKQNENLVPPDVIDYIKKNGLYTK